MDALDKLLAEIQAESQPGQTQPAQKANQANSFSPPVPKVLSLIDNILAEVGAEFAQEDAAIELRKQQELEEQRRREEKIKAQQREALKQQAQNWLAKLDPFSPEGLWFERFAENYPSKLEAAIEYLQTS